jgi:hypothetical protein
MDGGRESDGTQSAMPLPPPSSLPCSPFLHLPSLLPAASCHPSPCPSFPHNSLLALTKGVGTGEGGEAMEAVAALSVRSIAVIEAADQLAQVTRSPCTTSPSPPPAAAPASSTPPSPRDPNPWSLIPALNQLSPLQAPPQPPSP